MQNKLDNSYKEYSSNEEYLTTWTYDDLVTNLVNNENIDESITLKIIVNDLELTKESIITFDKEQKIQVILTTEYDYEINGTKKTEKIASEKDYIINYVDTVAPVLSGVKNKTITVGDSINILEGITATDAKEENIEVKYEGEVNTKKAGTYKIKIYAVDKNGNQATQEMTVTVKAKKTTSSTPSTGSTTKPNTGSTTSSCAVSNSVLTKRGYKPTQDKDACEKDRQATVIAKQIATEVLSQNLGTDLEKVNAAAAKVSEYYFQGVHIEEGYDYRTPYGVFIKGEASCAGCTRALIQVLELMGYTNLVHANENGWTHQWVILTMDGQTGFAEAQLGFAGYGEHPYA